MQHVHVVEFISSKMHNGVVVGHKRGLHITGTCKDTTGYKIRRTVGN